MTDAQEPFVMVPEWVLDAGLSASAIGVYCALRSYLNRRSGRCNPSATTIGAKVGLSHDQVQRYIGSLERARAIRIVYVPGKANQYGFLYQIPYASMRVVTSRTLRMTLRIHAYRTRRIRRTREREEEAKAALTLLDPGMEKKLWDYYIELVDPGPNYFFTH
jgi:helix-turn-helix protein